MPDIKKVIKGLECCTTDNCDGCPYERANSSLCPWPCNVSKMKEDALELLKEQEHKDKMFHALEDDWKRLKELLKEQEAVEPYHVNTNYEQHWKCGNCNAVISVQDKYCSTCGKPILWEGR